MKKVLLLSGFFISFFGVYSQVIENFNSWSDASYGTTSTYTGVGGDWESYNTMCHSSNSRSGNAIRLNDDSGQNEYLLFKGADGNGKDAGLGTLTFYYRHWDGDGSGVEFQAQYNQNGGGWSNIGSSVVVTSTTYNQFNITLNLTGDNILIRIIMIQDAERCLIDDLQITDYPVIATDLDMGDFAILGVNANNYDCSSVTGEDEISFVCFKDITNTTKLIFNDNGWERTTTGKWGDTEGVVRATRTSGTIAAGTVITFRMDNAGNYSSITPDASWSFTEINGSANFNMNSGGDQIWFMQGDTWDNNGGTGGHDATYTGDVLFGFNTRSIWAADGTTQQSNLVASMECFSMAPTGTSDYNKYTGPTTAATKRTWILRISDTANWTSYASCSDYNSTGPDYVGGYNLSMSAGAFSKGIWVGDKDIDWFDCANWQSLSIPDATVSVTLPSSGVTNQPTIATSGALCLDLNIESSGTLDINGTATLDIYDDFDNDGTLSHTAGTVTLKGTTTQTISGSSAIDFYQLVINNSSTGISLSRDVEISNALTLTDGVISTNSNFLIVSATIATKIIGGSSGSFIYGNLRRYIASNSSTYNFPIGNGTASTDFHPADVINNSLTGVTYIDASVTSITESGNNIDSRLTAAQGGTNFDNIAEDAEWNLVPNSAPTGGDYGVNLYVSNVSNLTDDQFAPLKRTSSSTDYVDWDSFESTTTIPGGGLAGRITSGGSGYAQRKGYTSFSRFAIAMAATALPLPVELLYFYATFQNKQVLINWETASETNSSHFDIQKSSDGINFYSICRKPSLYLYGGKYYFIDNKPSFGVSYYRLKQTDFDGGTEIFNSVAINNEFAFDDRIEVLQNRNQVIIRNISDATAHLSLISATGQIVKKVTLQPQAEISANFEIRGIYILTIVSQNVLGCKKLIY